MALMPEAASALERRLDDDAEARYAAVPVEMFGDMWDPHEIPLEYLAAMAWAFSIDGWMPDAALGARRAIVARYVQAHQRKGTERGVRDALDAMGALYEYTERPGGAAFRADITITNAASLLFTRTRFVATLNDVKRASVHHSYTYINGTEITTAIAAGAGIRRTRTLLLTLEASS